MDELQLKKMKSIVLAAQIVAVLLVASFVVVLGRPSSETGCQEYRTSKETTATSREGRRELVDVDCKSQRIIAN
ncbi:MULTISPECIES: hypothetical protein [Herbaspirillum]|uniref:Uncharacterized protein n=2 Tax=Herbaspirillum huttiense TaxID=863372 RepID=A0AAJ2HDW8_9BURK|nr:MULTISPECIES: hypothetical protein [Herbaspirillum]MDR9836970.1 hypothetical protein [Herbaspirillum huttiense]